MKYIKYEIQMILNLIIENHRRSELIREDGIIVRIWEYEEVFALKGKSPYVDFCVNVREICIYTRVESMCMY